jgi:DNA-binding response OmpR family regulator
MTASETQTVMSPLMATTAPLPAPLVLVVDDDDKLSDVLARSLERSGFTCLTAASGDQALWDQLIHAPDALVLDVMIPHPSGVEICGYLRARGFSGAIVMISARAQAEDRAAALRAGADAFLAKPFPLGLLVDTLRAAMEDRRVD